MKSILSAACLLFFTVAIILLYHFNPAIQRMVSHSAPVIVSLLFILSVCGLGSPFAAWLIPNHDKNIQILVSVAFGLGLTAILNVITGLLVRYSFSLFAVWYLAGIILFIKAFRRWRPISFHPSANTFWSVVSIIIFFLFIIPFIPFFVAPEVSTDAITYHLLLPKIFLSSGKLHFVPLFVEASYPNLAELNYLGILQLSGEIVCKTFHFWIGALLLLLLYSIVKKITRTSSALAAPALFLSMPLTVIHLGWAWNDFIFCLFVLLSLYFFLYIHEQEATGQTPCNYLLAGIFAGLASWTKYTFVLYFLASLLLLLLGARKWRWQPRLFVYYFFGIALVAPFWLLQNWLFTGNPVYPFLNHIFNSPYWTEAANRYFIYHLRRFEIEDWNWTTYFLFPARITLNPRIIETHTGILPFAFIPLLFFRSRSRGMTLLKFYLFFGIIVWLLIHTETRSILTLLAVFFCIVSVEVQETIRWRSALAAFTAAGLLTNFFLAILTTYHLFDPVGYFVGLESKSSYITRMVTGQRAYNFLNSKENVKRVLLVSLHNPFYFNQSYFLSDYSDPPVAEVFTQGLKSTEQIKNKLLSAHISHVILDPAKYKEENDIKLYSWSLEQRKLFETFLLKECRQVARFSDSVVYEVDGSEAYAPSASR